VPRRSSERSRALFSGSLDRRSRSLELRPGKSGTLLPTVDRAVRAVPVVVCHRLGEEGGVGTNPGQPEMSKISNPIQKSCGSCKNRVCPGVAHEPKGRAGGFPQSAVAETNLERCQSWIDFPQSAPERTNRSLGPGDRMFRSPSCQL